MVAAFFFSNSLTEVFINNCFGFFWMCEKKSQHTQGNDNNPHINFSLYTNRVAAKSQCDQEYHQGKFKLIVQD